MSPNTAIPRGAAGGSVSEPAEQLIDFFRDNARNLAIGVGVAFAVAIGYAFWQSTQASNDKAASVLVTQAYDEMAGSQLDAAAGRLNDVLSRYGGTKSASRARLLLGGLELARGNAAAANTQYDAFLSKTGPSDYLWSGGQRGRAVALENQNKFADAAQAYEKLLTAPLGIEEQARALYDAARAWQQAGNAEKSVAALDRITKEFGTSRVAANARLLRGEVGGGQ